MQVNNDFQGLSNNSTILPMEITEISVYKFLMTTIFIAVFAIFMIHTHLTEVPSELGVKFGLFSRFEKPTICPVSVADLHTARQKKKGNE